MGTEVFGKSTTEVEWNNRTLSADAVFETLANGHRRAALSCLLECNATIPVDDLVDRVAASVDGDQSDDYRDQLRTQFYHSHLPKLSDLGVIEYRHVPEVVEPQPVIDEFEPFLEWASSLEAE